MDKYTNEKVILCLKKLFKNLNKEIKIDKAILFGSRAREDYLYNSDVDLIIVSKNFKGMKFQDRTAIIFSYWDEYIDLEVLCYTPEEFERMKKRIGIVNQGVKEGKELIY